MPQSCFDPGRYKWREVTGEPGLSYKVRHDYTILGHDLAAGRGHTPAGSHLDAAQLAATAGSAAQGSGQLFRTADQQVDPRRAGIAHGIHGRRA